MARDSEAARRETLVAVARMYYEQDLSQQEIAGKLDVSRSSVSNMLKLCREQGIVEFRINDESSHAARLARELRTRYGLDDAVVIAGGGDPALDKAHVGLAAARLLRPLLRDGLRIGISWGTTLFECVRQVEPIALRGVEVLQLHGGLGSGDPAIDGFGLAQHLAEKLQGSYRIVQAPIVVHDIAVKTMLLREPGIGQVIRDGALADIALFGIGSNIPEISSLVRAGFLSSDESKAVLAGGAVATVCGLQIDAAGVPVSSDFNDRLIGIDRAGLGRIPVRVGVVSGAEKGPAVRAALRGRFVTMLVTDEAIARVLLAE
jgi:DNA-binding transcriptional regulator LsrR (DeoR family)